MNNEIKTALKIYKTFFSHYNTYACNMWAIGRDIDTKSAKSTLSMNLKSFFMPIMWIFPHILFVIENTKWLSQVLCE